jgi:signal transduction histidine kinase
MTEPAALPAAAVQTADQAAERRGGLSRPGWAAAIVFVAALSLAAGLIWLYEEARIHDARDVASDLVAERAYAIEHNVDRVLSATYALAAMLQQGRGHIPQFEEIAGQLLRHYPGATALQLAPGGIVRQVVPLQGNEKALGHDLLNDPQPARAARLSRDGDQLVLAGPFQLLQGGLGAAGRLPVFLDDGQGQRTFWGLAIVLIAFPEALAPAKLAELVERGYAYELSRTLPGSDQKQVIAASSRAQLLNPVERVVRLPNAPWTLRLAPAAGWNDLPGLYWKAALGLLFSALLAWQAALRARLIGRTRVHERTLERRVRQRTADLQRFAEVVAHHLREPARLVASYASRLNGQLAGRLDDDEVHLSLDFIGQQARRLQDLLRDVERYLAADQARGTIAHCDVELALQSLLATLADRLAEAKASVEVLGTLPAAMIDAPRLLELFRIALDNALLHARGEQPLRILIAGEQSGRVVRYRISDNGPGIEEIYRERVFNVFERLSSTGRGTGVGLAILRRIAESVAGRAWLDEAPGGGCRVLIELPAAGQAEPARQGRGDLYQAARAK